MTKIDFLLKLHFLHFLAKFKQKIPKKSKNMAEKAVFGPKKGHFGPEKRTKMTKIVFSLKLHFLHFLSKFRQKKAKKKKKNGQKRRFGPTQTCHLNTSNPAPDTSRQHQYTNTANKTQ